MTLYRKDQIKLYCCRCRPTSKTSLNLTLKESDKYEVEDSHSDLDESSPLS